MDNQIQGFDFDRSVRMIWDDETGERWYAIVDVVELLTETSNSRSYLYDLKKRDPELSEIIRQFPMLHKTNGRTYKTDCASQEGMLRVIQSIPSPKAEPFKQWLAVTGSRRLDEIKADPIEAMRERLRLAGIDEKSINRRIEALKTNQKLTGEWTQRQVKPDEQEILSDEVHKGTFDGMTRQDHADLKSLDDGDYLRDHMTDLEIAFSILGDATTLDQIHHDQPQGFEENKEVAIKSGDTAGKLRKVWEEEKGRKVITDKSALTEAQKRLQKKDDDKTG